MYELGMHTTWKAGMQHVCMVILQVDIVNVGCVVPTAWSTDFGLQLLLPLFVVTAAFTPYLRRCAFRRRNRSKESEGKPAKEHTQTLAQTLRHLPHVWSQFGSREYSEAELIKMRNRAIASSAKFMNIVYLSKVICI